MHKKIAGIFSYPYLYGTNLDFFISLGKNHSIVTGKKGERIIRDFLTAKGYRILETNWRFGKKEIDIIAESAGGMLIFVEVKTRRTRFEENPASSVSVHKQKNLISAAHHYIQSYERPLSGFRFDIATLITLGHTQEINYIENAFYPF